MIGAVADALLPPAIGPILALVLLAVGRRRAAALVVAALVLLAVECVPQWLIAPLLTAPGPAPTAAPGAIVVLSGGRPGLLDTSQTVPSLETLERLRTAATLYRRTGAPILASGARAADGPVPVAAQMALSLQTDFGVPVTWAETDSVNLWQSAAASAAMLREAGIDRVYLVGQPWEFRLGASVFRAAGLAVTPAPISHAGPGQLDWTAFMVVTPVWLDSAIALEQWAGLACQAVAPCATLMRTQGTSAYW